MSLYERLIWIDARIRAHAYPDADDVANEFEVSRRQAYEDRAHLAERLGAPIAYSRRHGGWYYTDPSYFLPAISLGQGELLAFLLAQQLSHRYLGTPFEEEFASALRKIREYLPQTVTVDADTLSRSVTFSGGFSVDTDPTLLLDLHRAAAERRTLDLTYYSPRTDETTQRAIDPYHLHNIRGDWYLIAYCHLRRAVLDFLVSRIRRCEIREERFTPIPEFDLTRYLGQGFMAERGPQVYSVQIRFDAYQAGWARERKYHDSQTLEELPDGGVLLTIETGGLEEVARWVLGFGSHAEVLTPPELRERVASEARSTALLYEKPVE